MTEAASISLASPHPPTPKISPRSWFTTEILQMMHGFGDCRRPVTESGALIEEIVHQQITEMLYQASEVAQQRNARFIGIEDFLYLLRKDKVKLRRLIRYLELKDMKAISLRNEEEDQTDSAPVKKRRKVCYDFLYSIDQTGELVALFDDTDKADEVKQERALRAELQTRKMDHQQYIDFTQARQASFCRRYKSQKFKEWAMFSAKLDIKPNPFAMEVLSYMAYETVAQIVDITLLVKRDVRTTTGNPFQQVLPSVCVNHFSQSVQMPPPASVPPVSPGLKSPGSKIVSPAPSPPTTPTAHAPSTFILTQPTTSSLSKKSKKKKKSAPVMMMEMPKDTAIQPSDIREAIRRYGTSTGPFSPFVMQPTLPRQRHILLSC